MSQMRRPVRTHVVCGFLGAGKTTFVLELLRRNGANAAVIVNDFGTLGVDGETIRRRGGVDVVEMPGGCVCCSQRAGLVASVKDVAERIVPELLLIEPSGVAEASSLIETLRDESLDGLIELGATVAIADADTFADFAGEFGSFFKDQIEQADVILLNKTDLVKERDLCRAEEQMHSMNPRARILRTEYCRFDFELFTAEPVEKVAAHRASLSLEAMSVEPGPRLERTVLEEFLSGLTRGLFGEVLRAKGFVQVDDGTCVAVQATGRRSEIESLEHETASRLTLVGRGMDQAAILAALGGRLAGEA